MEMTDKSIKAVCDAGPIIHLDELDCLNLLSEFSEILLSETVRKEINQHRPFALEKSGLSFIKCSQEYPVNESLHTMCRIFSLDAGEIKIWYQVIYLSLIPRCEQSELSSNFFRNPDEKCLPILCHPYEKSFRCHQVQSN